LIFSGFDIFAAIGPYIHQTGFGIKKQIYRDGEREGELRPAEHSRRVQHSTAGRSTTAKMIAHAAQPGERTIAW
jgi:hypothetical protein